LVKKKKKRSLLERNITNKSQLYATTEAINPKIAKLGRREAAPLAWVHVTVGDPSKGARGKVNSLARAAVVKAVSSTALSAAEKAGQSVDWEEAPTVSEKALVVNPVETAHLQVLPALLRRAERTAE